MNIIFVLGSALGSAVCFAAAFIIFSRYSEKRYSQGYQDGFVRALKSIKVEKK